MAFPFEALEVFTYQLKKVATSRYVGDNAPTGLLATLNGLAGCMHYAFGKGMILKWISSYVVNFKAHYNYVVGERTVSPSILICFAGSLIKEPFWIIVMTP